MGFSCSIENLATNLFSLCLTWNWAENRKERTNVNILFSVSSFHSWNYILEFYDMKIKATKVKPQKIHFAAQLIMCVYILLLMCPCACVLLFTSTSFLKTNRLMIKVEFAICKQDSVSTFCEPNQASKQIKRKRNEERGYCRSTMPPAIYIHSYIISLVYLQPLLKHIQILVLFICM